MSLQSCLFVPSLIPGPTSFNQVKAHKTSVVERERDMLAREAALIQREEAHAAELKRRDAEITDLHAHLAEVQASVPRAIAAREDELRAAVLRREAEVAAVMQRREEELLAAVRAREAEIEDAWRLREAQIRDEVETETEERWKDEWDRLAKLQHDVEKGMRNLFSDKKDKMPLEEVKNVLEPLRQLTDGAHPTPRRRISPFETPLLVRCSQHQHHRILHVSLLFLQRKVPTLGSRRYSTAMQLWSRKALGARRRRQRLVYMSGVWRQGLTPPPPLQVHHRRHLLRHHRRYHYRPQLLHPGFHYHTKLLGRNRWAP